jgi:uncharacterized protein (TIGR00730 family)
MSLRRVCVYCGSSAGNQPAYEAGAIALASELAERGVGLVYGGSHVGLMGVLADTMLAAGGDVIGVIPEALIAKEIGHTALPQLIVVGSMHERKTKMSELADAFIAMPGGFGTLEEFAEAVTWTQLGIHDKACGLLNIEGYWQPLLSWMDQAVAEGFLKAANRSLVIDADEPGPLLDRLETWQPVSVEKWIAPATGLEP